METKGNNDDHRKTPHRNEPGEAFLAITSHVGSLDPRSTSTHYILPERVDDCKAHFASNYLPGC